MATTSALTRRQLLIAGAGAAAAAAGGAWLGAPRSRAARRSRGRLVVVGAGMAGLAAATDARAAGWDVIVLEARDRVGGRVLTFRGFAAGQVAEAGGEYLDSDHTVMRRYARRFGLRLDDVYAAGSDKPACAFFGGRRTRAGVLDTPRVRRDVDRFYTALGRLSDRLAPNDPVADGAALDRRSVADFLDSLGLSAAGRAAIERSVIRDDYTVEAADLSLLFLAQGDSLPGGQEERFRVRGGNDQIPAALARSLGSRVVLGAPVTAIARDATGVTVTAGGTTVRADACVLAAPLPALRAIAFSPALPARLADAVAHLQYGTGAKAALQYDTRIWRRQGFGGDLATDLPVTTAWEATDAQRGRPGVLLGYTMGAPGAAAAALSDADRIAADVADLERVYPGSAAEFASGQTRAWSDEPYTGGTYTAYAPGQVTAYWRVLRRPVGRIVLAGEHTSALTGYMEGAARSGRRAARLVARLRR